MKNVIILLLLFVSIHIAYCQKNDNEIIYNDIKYTYKVSEIGPQKYSVEITRTNISKQKVIVMDAYHGQDFDTLYWHHYSDSIDKDLGIPPFHYPNSRGNFDRDTLIDYFSELDEIRKTGGNINCDGRCTFTQILLPGLKNKVKFNIRATNDQFYFYEKYWFAEPSDKEDDVKWIPLKERKAVVVCFPIKVKIGNN
jgi:hypothetical protein